MVFETLLLSHLQVHGLGEEVYPDGGLVCVVEAVVHKPGEGHFRRYPSYVAEKYRTIKYIQDNYILCSYSTQSTKTPGDKARLAHALLAQKH